MAEPVPGVEALWRDTKAKLDQQRCEEQRQAQQVTIPGHPSGDEQRGDPLLSPSRNLEEDNPTLHERAQALTRLGAPSVTVVVLATAEMERAVLTRRPTREEAKFLLERSVSLTYRGLARALFKSEGPAGWRHSPLLRHARCVELCADGATDIDGYRLTLDTERGIVIEPRPSAVHAAIEEEE